MKSTLILAACALRKKIKIVAINPKMLATLVAAFLLYGTSIVASATTYSFSGILTDIRQSGAGLAYGDAFNAFYVHDESPQLGSLIESGRSLFSGGTFTIEASGKSFIGSATSELQVFDNWTNAYGGYYNADGFFVSSYIYDTNGLGFYLIQFDLWDFTGSTLSSLSLPDQRQIEQLAHNGRLWIRRFENGTERGLSSGNFSQFSSISLSVPEPETYALMLLALTILGFTESCKETKRLPNEGDICRVLC